MKREWYVLQTLTGQEQKVRNLIVVEKRIQGLGDNIGEVLMPTEKVTTVKNNKKTTITKKLYPGYVFVEATLYGDDGKIYEPVWTFMRSMQGVIGFLGGDTPVPMSAEEVASVKGAIEESQTEKPKPKIVFEPGDYVRIKEGPFQGSEGSVVEIDPDRCKMKVVVQIFGREIPAELEYWQAERAERADEQIRAQAGFGADPAAPRDAGL